MVIEVLVEHFDEQLKLLELICCNLTIPDYVKFRSDTFLQNVVWQSFLLVRSCLKDELQTLESCLHNIVLLSLVSLEDDSDHLRPKFNCFEV